MKLSREDKANLKAALANGYATPLTNPKTGMMLARQWRSWLKLQGMGLATIEGDGEAEDLVLTDAGKAAAIKEGK